MMKHIPVTTIKNIKTPKKKSNEEERTNWLTANRGAHEFAAGSVKMNFTPGTSFNGGISLLLGKMEDLVINHESHTFPLTLLSP